MVMIMGALSESLAFLGRLGALGRQTHRGDGVYVGSRTPPRTVTTVIVRASAIELPSVRFHTSGKRRESWDYRNVPGKKSS